MTSHRSALAALVLLAGLAGRPQLVSAQDDAAIASDRASFLGITASLTPYWDIEPGLESRFFNSPGQRGDISGSAWQVGVVRGNPERGHWGLSFRERRVKDGSRVENPQTRAECLRGLCKTAPREFATTSDTVRLTGVEAHRYFVPAVFTLGPEFQVGFALSGGASMIRGTVVRESLVGDPPSTVAERQPARSWGNHRITPTGSAEFVVSVKVAPVARLEAGGGFSYPGYHTVRIGIVYFIAHASAR